MLWTILAVVAVLVVARIAAGFVWPSINDVATGATPQYPDIQPQVFPVPPGRALAAAEATVRDMGWDVSQAGDGTIRAVATTRLLRFRDDVTITVRPEGPGTRVDIRSKSRLGRSDFGTNARRIRALQARLAERLL